MSHIIIQRDPYRAKCSCGWTCVGGRTRGMAWIDKAVMDHLASPGEKPVKGEKVYTVDKVWSSGNGGRIHVSRAEIVSTHWKKAVKAAKEGHVSFRHIDSYDESDEKFVDYMYQPPCEDSSEHAQRPRRVK